jgi:tetratricopeptide (TPR) repeat protein
MKNKYKIRLSFNYFLLTGILFAQSVFAQDVDIVQYLKQIESGKIIEVREALINLKKENPQSPSVLFLEAVLTENGQEAVVKYQYIVDTYPKSKYADAALYRIYSYYYALGLYETANEKLKKLMSDYPGSPYVNIARQNKLPGEGGLAEDDVSEFHQEETTNVQTINDTQYKFTIQAGAFTNFDNAKSLRNDFDNAGIFSEIRDKIVGGTNFHVVYAGKFLNEEEAENFLAIINSRFNLSGRIVSITWNQ